MPPREPVAANPLLKISLHLPSNSCIPLLLLLLGGEGESEGMVHVKDTGPAAAWS